VLSALEGIKTPLPAFAPYVLPLSVVVLIAVFGLQPQGTARIGRLFGQVMTLWFVTIGVLGLAGIGRHPAVLVALDPRCGLDYLFAHGLTGFLVLGGVFLCATGAEALYADMGHFGRLPIRITWYGLVLPTLLLNYAGQAALVVDGEVAAEANPFFELCPPVLQLPLVVLAAAATIIASQAIISGTFSMTRQLACLKIIVTNGRTQYVELSDIDFQIIKFTKYRHHDTVNWRRKNVFLLWSVSSNFSRDETNDFVMSMS
jgi:KUP system potassium uptake protein